jgi:hypothetical protein
MYHFQEIREICTTLWLGEKEERCWRNMLTGDDNMGIGNEELELYGVTNNYLIQNSFQW